MYWDGRSYSLVINKGIPDANFTNANCDISSYFGPASIIINISLCERLTSCYPLLTQDDTHLGGDWAGDGDVYDASSGRPNTCTGTSSLLSCAALSKEDLDIEFVNTNPRAFTDAFFEFSWIKVYQ